MNRFEHSVHSRDFESLPKALTAGETPSSTPPSGLISADLSPYQSVIQYADGLPELERRVETLRDKEIRTKELLEMLASPDWDFTGPLLSDENFPLYCLAALKEGKINADIFGTLCIFWSFGVYHRSRDQPLPSCRSLFKGDSMDKPTELILRSTLKFLPPYDRYIKGEVDTYNDLEHLSEQQYQRFIEIVRKLPRSEQYFLVAADLQDPKTATNKAEATSSQRLNFFEKTNFLSRFSLSGQSYRMIPSVGMLKAFLVSICGEQSLIFTPILGDFHSSEKMELESAKKGQRHLTLLMWDGKDVKKTFNEQEIDYFYFLFSRCLVSSYIPFSHRQILLSLFEAWETHTEERVLDDLKYRFLFLNFGAYQRAADLQHKLALFLRVLEKQNTLSSSERVRLQDILLDIRDSYPKKYQILMQKFPNLTHASEHGDPSKELELVGGSVESAQRKIHELELIRDLAGMEKTSFQPGLGQFPIEDLNAIFQDTLGRTLNFFNSLKPVEDLTLEAYRVRLQLFKEIEGFLKQLAMKNPELTGDVYKKFSKSLRQYRSDNEEAITSHLWQQKSIKKSSPKNKPIQATAGTDIARQIPPKLMDKVVEQAEGDSKKKPEKK